MSMSNSSGNVRFLHSLLAISPLQIVVGDIGLLAVLSGLSFLGYQHGFVWLFKVRVMMRWVVRER